MVEVSKNQRATTKVLSKEQIDSNQLTPAQKEFQVPRRMQPKSINHTSIRERLKISWARTTRIYLNRSKERRKGVLLGKKEARLRYRDFHRIEINNQSEF